MYPDSNIYKKSLIYTQREFMGGSPQSKPFIEELITKSSKFPASQAPDSNQMAKIETAFQSAPHDSSLWRQNGESRQHLTGRQKKRRKKRKVTLEKK